MSIYCFKTKMPHNPTAASLHFYFMLLAQMKTEKQSILLISCLWVSGLETVMAGVWLRYDWTQWRWVLEVLWDPSLASTTENSFVGDREKYIWFCETAFSGETLVSIAVQLHLFFFFFSFLNLNVSCLCLKELYRNSKNKQKKVKKWKPWQMVKVG